MAERSRPALAVAILTALSLLVLASCGDVQRQGPVDEALGGDTTRDDGTRNAFGLPAANLASADRRKFEQGDSFFTQNWVTAPASTGARDGLGPVFNAQSCSSCHVLDGRGAPPADENDTATRGLLVRLSVPGETPAGGPLPEPTYGDQLQDRSIEGVPAEGRLVVSYDELPGRYRDGTEYSLRIPSYRFADLAFGPMHPDTMISPRLAPQTIGMGLLEAIPEQSILAGEDPDDADGDGVSGRANRVRDERNFSSAIGRFGWKANQATVESQTAGAFHGDIGITSTRQGTEECTAVQIACTSAQNGGSPELDDERLAAVVFYTRTLAVPAMRHDDSRTLHEGARQFTKMGCSACHTSTFETGVHDLSAVSNQTIHPFTDLLLHDMGAELADGRADFEATGREWRTPPLWGLGLADDVNGHRFLLHDGRARDMEEAILWHGGEAEQSKEFFRNASAAERKALLQYLESL